MSDMNSLNLGGNFGLNYNPNPSPESTQLKPEHAPSTLEDMQTAFKQPSSMLDLPGHMARLHAADRLGSSPIGQFASKRLGVSPLSPWQQNLAHTLRNPNFIGSMATGPLAGITKAVGGVGGMPLLAGAYGMFQHGTGLNDLKLLLGGGMARKTANDLLDRHLSKLYNS